MAETLTRCATCPGKTNVVPGGGPAPSRVFFVGEEPGETENRKKRAFCGKAGHELDGLYLNECARLPRASVYVTNAVKCRLASNRTPTLHETLTCAAHHLPAELQACKPDLVVLMGATACKLSDPPVDLDAQHGIPFVGRVLDWQGWIIPTYHPARGLHQTTWMTALIEDFTAIRQFLDDTFVWPVDEYPDAEFELLVGDEVAGVLRRAGRSTWAGVDTESDGRRPYSVQFAYESASGYMVMADDQVGLNALRKWLPSQTIAFHHALADLPVLRELEVWTDGTPYECTMQMAYQCGLPQGLKPLAYRLLGVRMQSFDDLVGPPSREAVLEWLTGVLLGLKEVREQRVSPIKKVVSHHEVPHPLAASVRRLFKHTDKPEGDYSPWEAWTNVREKFPEEAAEVEDEHGGMPRRGLSQVALDEVVQYGCRDANVTLRVREKLHDRQLT